MATGLLLCGCLLSILIYPVIYHTHPTLSLTLLLSLSPRPYP